MGAVIDSSILIAAERGKLDFEQVLRDYGHEPVAIAAIPERRLKEPHNQHCAR